MAESFSARLRERLLDAGPLCVGIDPSRDVLSAWGRADDVEGVEFAALSVLDAVIGVAAVIKPQVAFFERFGSAGYRVLERVIREAGEADVVVVADAKRGDVVTTNEGYAEAWLEEGSPLAVDAVTVSPYLGVEALTPFFTHALAAGRGVFVLAATSNPEGRTIQSARTDEQDRLQDHVLRLVTQFNHRDGVEGSLGVVLGATRTAPDVDLATLGGPFLVPGVGAQGAGVTDVARLFDRCPPGSVLVNVSRGILRAGPERRGLRDAARRWRDDLREVL